MYRRLTTATAVLSILAASAVCAQVATQQPSATVTQAFHGRLEALARELDRVLGQAVRTEDRGFSERLRDDMAGLRGHLRLMRRDLGQLEPGDAEVLGNKLRNLENLASNLERAASSSESPPDPGQGRRPSLRLGDSGRGAIAPPVNDDCANATVVLGGETILTGTVGATNDGSASCGASVLGPDIWFKYVSTSSAQFLADTIGSDFDTVVSVHFECPGRSDNEQTCNDDTVGLQSATNFFTFGAGTEWWIRVSGFDQAAGNVVFHFGTGGAVSGLVTSEAAGTPLAGGMVELHDADGFFAGSGTTGATGEYSIALSTARELFATARGFDGFIDELYEDTLCTGGLFAGCSPEDGTALVLDSVNETTGVDLALAAGGGFSGTVTHTSTGDPLPGAQVLIFNAEGAEVGSTVTGADGTYEATGLNTGSYFAAVSIDGYADELYDDLPWAPSGVDPTGGTAIPVVALQTTSGIDFALDRFGFIEGTVTSNATGAPLHGNSVELTILDASGDPVAFGTTAMDGSYSIGGLSAGDYKVVARVFFHVTEAFDDIPCPGSSFHSCDLASASPLTIGLNLGVTGVDFGVDELGKISGTVTQAQGGAVMSGVEVAIWDDTGSFVRSDSTNASGAYLVEFLPAGNYFAVTDAPGMNHLDELYDDLPCPTGGPPGCDPLAGTPVTVALNDTTTGIDFALDPGGSISGRVTTVASGVALPAEVSVWNMSGEFLFETPTNSNGEYSAEGLPAGNYFVSASSVRYVTEIFQDVACLGVEPPDCDPTGGTSVAVTLNADTPDVDFALNLYGGIAGTVTSSQAGLAVYAHVSLWDENGTFVRNISSDYYGGYFSGSVLVPGTYFATAHTHDYLDALYQGQLCVPTCDPTTGTPIVVSLDTTLTEIDFDLLRKGYIIGTVTDMEGNPLAATGVRVWDGNGSEVGFDLTSSSGFYEVKRLDPGSYFVTTYSSVFYLDEIHNDIPCIDVENCDLTKGDPVVVGVSTTTQVDFDLRARGRLRGRVTDFDTGAPLSGVAVDLWDDNGFRYGSTSTGVEGEYSIDVQPGIFFLSTTNQLGFVDELFDGFACIDGPASLNRCDPTQGEPVNVQLGSTITDVDFALVDIQVFSDGFESGNVSMWSSASP